MIGMEKMEMEWRMTCLTVIMKKRLGRFYCPEGSNGSIMMEMVSFVVTAFVACFAHEPAAFGRNHPIYARSKNWMLVKRIPSNVPTISKVVIIFRSVDII